jgi:hypothetical protein
MRVLARLIPLLCVITILIGCEKKEQAAQEASAPAQALRGPQIVQDMVAAHGGIEAWRNAPTVSFVDEFSVPGAPAAMVSQITVEQGRRRSYMNVPQAGAAMTWDGSRAWSTNWVLPMPPRFVAQLNYYFLNLPWLTQDPGVKLVEAGTGKVLGETAECALVMMTFEPGVGDTPDDYYRLYIDPVSKRLRACDYVVTYGSLLPAGVEATPEHHLVYESYETVSGLLVPASYTVYEAGKVYGTCRIRDWSFSQPFDETRMQMPEGAAVDTTAP